MSGVWHHKGITRLDTEKMLLESAKDGSFLIRDSESVANAFVLSLIFQGHIHHYRIFRRQDGRFYMQAVPGVDNQHFELLEQIVIFYSQPEKGLPCQLKYPVICSSNDEDDSDEDEEEEDYPEEEVNNTKIDRSSASAQNTIKRQMSQVNSEGVDQEFKDAAAYYLGEPLLMDFKTATSGGTKLEGLQKLIANSSQDLVKELKLLVSRLEFLQNVFSVNDKDHTTKMKFTTSAEESSSDYEYLCRLLGNGVGGISTLHVQALKSLKDIGKMEDKSGGKHEQEKRTQSAQSRKFEVIDRSSSFKGKTYLLVDYIEGKISFLKNQSESPEPGNTILHSKILQLIKSRTNIKRLGIKIESKPSKEYDFDDGKSREVFCQLVQQVKNQKSKNSTVEQISVFVGTWNLGDANPPENLGTWFKCQGHGNTRDTDVAHFAHDIYAIGTQECSLSENNWVTRIKNELRDLFEVDFKSVGTCSLWGIRLVVLVKTDHANLISHVHQSSVKTGIANALGNKGAVGISFMFSATSLCFINCHLAARSTRILRRKQNYHDILKGLNLGQKSGFDLTNQFHHVFWFGDLNYRLDMDVTVALQSIKANDLYKMRKADQLWSEIKKGNVFCGFKEETVNFLPTYRHKRGGNAYEYVWEKAKRSGTLINVPSWCDRVLYHSFPETKIFNMCYGCTDDIRTSDHWPVFSTFDVGIISQYAASPTKSGKNISKEDCKIVFNLISAKIKTNSKPQFIIEFHSSCLESTGKSNANSIIKPGSADERGKISEAHPQWTAPVLPQNLYPIVPDRNYLQDQHLLLVVKSVDSDECYGECCISLKAMIADTYQKFEAKLTHSGEETGEISGEMLVKVPDDTEIVNQGGLIKEGDDDDVSTTSKPISKPIKNPTKQPRYSSHSVKERNPAPLPKRRPASHPTKVDTSAPPPLPAKNRPPSVMDLLKRIGFPQFHDILVNNGFDQVEFLKDISESDLKGTAVPEHVRKKLVTSIHAVVNNQ